MNPFSKFARLARRRRRDAWVRAFRAGPEVSASVRPGPHAGEGAVQAILAEQRRVNRIVALCGSLDKARMIVDLMAEVEPREQGKLREDIGRRTTSRDRVVAIDLSGVPDITKLRVSGTINPEYLHADPGTRSEHRKGDAYKPGDHTRAALRGERLQGRHYRRPAPADPPPASSLQEAALDAMDADWRANTGVAPAKRGNGPVIVNIMGTPKRCNRCGGRID